MVSCLMCSWYKYKYKYKYKYIFSKVQIQIHILKWHLHHGELLDVLPVQIQIQVQIQVHIFKSTNTNTYSQMACLIVSCLMCSWYFSSLFLAFSSVTCVPCKINQSASSQTKLSSLSYIYKSRQVPLHPKYIFFVTSSCFWFSPMEARSSSMVVTWNRVVGCIWGVFVAVFCGLFSGCFELVLSIFVYNFRAQISSLREANLLKLSEM